MNTLVRRGTPWYQAQLQARALNAWRDAELVVRARWDAFLVADGASRRDAFAAYVAALDAEPAAAGDLADASSDLAEARGRRDGASRGDMKDQLPAAVRAGRKDILPRLARAPEFGTAVAAVLLYAFFALYGGSNGFTSVAGTASWLNTAAYLGVIAVPVGLLMIAGEFDLSTGSVVGVSSITVGLLNGYYHHSLLLSAVVAIAIGIAVGVANGLLVTKTRVPAFIVTLATNYIFAGLALAIAQSVAHTTQVHVLASGVSAEFAGQAGQFNVAILWWLVVAVSGIWVLTRRRFGIWILATGGSNEDARRAGVLTARVKLAVRLHRRRLGAGRHHAKWSSSRLATQLPGSRTSFKRQSSW